ncbi:carbohydrate ABC transporter permease [Arthrobacter castelli]|uniref:carbohydrate ABC transporter permease n=1 Tax=Arthrobacter castelli TaxID=271431 RepID=UPI0006868A32|nr:sugar ABC transporter permease [Arthrobacter castelli]
MTTETQVTVPRNLSLVTAKGRKRKKRDTLAAIIFIGPMTLGLSIFYLWPLVRTFFLSFTKWGAFGGTEFTGLENYERLINDSDVWQALLVSFGYTGIVLLGIPVAIVMAVLLNQKNLKWLTGYRVLFFLPVVTMPVAAALVWRLLYNGRYGAINYILSWFGIDGPSWLTQPGLALVAIGIVGVWLLLGQQIIILLAGLQGVPRTLLESSAIDGANAVQRFRYVTLPLLTPSIFFVVVITVIGCLQMFDLVFVMLEPGNPALASTKTIVYYFYQVGFVYNDRGYAAAIAFLLMVIIFILTALQFRLQKRWVHYE